MPETILPLTWPSKGLVEAWAFSDQPQESAREYQNVRYQDCVTMRLRGAKRAGMSKYLTSALKAPGTKGVGLVSFFVDNRQVTYSAIASGSETVTWDELMPSKKGAVNVKTDRQGNVYSLDGSSVAKFSADGQLLWQLALPAKDPNHSARALWVDEFDLVYVGVSSGGVQATAALWCYEQLPENKTEQLWEIQPKAYIEEIVTSQGKLYTCQNRTDRKKSLVRVYEFIDTANPELAIEWRVPHPVNSIAVKKDGSVIVACAASTEDTTLYWRDRDPIYPESSPDSIDWDMDRLTNADRRLWARLIGDSIDQTDVVSDISDGVGLIRLRDSSKNNRHMYATIGDGQATVDEPPVLAMDAYLEHKGVRFNKGTQDGPHQALRSLPNSSISTAFADQQRTLLPAYGSHTNGSATNSGWAMFIVCRPSQSAQDAVATQRWLIGQDRDNASSGSDFHELFLNATSTNGNSLPPTASAGGVFWYTGETALSGGDGTGGQIRQGTFTSRQDNGSNPDGTTVNKGQIAIITMVCDGAISNTSTNAQKSFFRINGSPIDSFQSRAQATLSASFIGIYREAINSSDTNPTTGVKNTLGDVLEIVVLDRQSRTTDTDAIVTCDDLQFDSLATSQTINEVTTIEGMLAHKYGAQINLPYGTAAVNNYPHPFGITGTGQDRLSGPPTLNTAGSVAVSAAQALANKAFACVVKYDPKGHIVWCANEMELISGDRSGGYGKAVAIDSDGNILSFGDFAIGSGSHDFVVLRKIIDQGTDFSIQVADGAWSVSEPIDSIFADHPRIDVDEFKNVYVPWAIDLGTTYRFKVYSTSGTLLNSASFDAGTTIAVAVDRRIPEYRNDLTTKRVEHVAVVGSPNAATDEAVFKVRLVSSAQASGAVRTLYSMGVSGGDIVRFTTSGVTTPTGGSGALDSTAKYVQATTLFKKAYWTDGRQLKVFEPITNAVTEYKCLSAGAIPSRCALIESWRGRIVLARSADEPHNWFMSKKDEPTNWDYFPPVPSEVDAVAGNNSSAGLCPDIINSIVPYSEDWLLFGGDHSIWALVGDPAAGGRLELVSDITGMAFGRPWCKDPNGVLYFVGSRGGLFRWVPGAKPERISLGRIERQLQDIDFAAYHVKLAWNYQDEGVHILQCPFGAGATQVAHWFYEARPDGFAKDIFGTPAFTNVQPTDVHVLDGDDFNDRVMIFACEDGFVRKWDSSAKSDDTRTDGTTKIPIDAFVTWFPIQAGEQMTGMETQFHGLTVVLGDRDDGVRYELFSSDEPDALGVSRVSGFFGPGRNPPSWEKVVGSYCGLRLRNAAAEERFTFERALIYASMAGMSRPRARN